MINNKIYLTPTDPFELTPPRQPQGALTLADARARLKTLGVHFTQPTTTQIKVGPINFWPEGKGGGGRIHIDGCTKHPEQGWDAFINLLQKHGLMRLQSVPSHPPFQSRPQSARAPANQGVSAFIPTSGPCGRFLRPRLLSWVHSHRH